MIDVYAQDNDDGSLVLTLSRSNKSAVEPYLMTYIDIIDLFQDFISRAIEFHSHEMLASAELVEILVQRQFDDINDLD